MSTHPNKYLVVSAKDWEKMEQKPVHFGEVKPLPDGKVIIETKGEPVTSQGVVIHSNEHVTVMTHEEAVAYLNTFRPGDEPAKPMKQSHNRKAIHE